MASLHYYYLATKNYVGKGVPKMEEYERLEMEVVEFEADDVITESGPMTSEERLVP